MRPLLPPVTVRRDKVLFNYRPVGELVRIVGRQLVDDATRARHRRRQVVGLRVSPVAIIFTRYRTARPIGARDDDK